MRKFFSKDSVFKNWIYILAFILILGLGVYLRIFRAEELFLYSHDNDLAGWIVKDIVLDKHPRLIGQETSTQGVYIGSLFYYLQVPFYKAADMDPIGVTYIPLLLGIISTASFYYVFSRIFDKRVGILAMLLQGVSFYTVFVEREVVPTSPVFLWSIWLLYALHLILSGKQKRGFILAGVLGGFIWQINVVLVLPYFLILPAFYMSKKKIDLKGLVLGIATFIVTNLPLVVFELKHNFIQTRAILSSLTTTQSQVFSFGERVTRTVHLMGKNATSLFFANTISFKYENVLFVSLIIFLVLWKKKLIETRLAKLLFAWIAIYLVFFSVYSKILSEYYLNGAIVVFIAIAAVFLSSLIKNRNLSLIGIVFVSAFCYFNYQSLVNLEVDRSGYHDRKDIVRQIKSDMGNKHFPCVAISYITKPGYNLGYRYFFWMFDVHANHPDSGAPVYTIVYPLRKDIKADKTYGAIGLIYPDYSRYTKEGIEKSCSGQNSNLTDPMFGFTK